MRKRDQKWQDLLDSSVDVETIHTIATDVKDYPIFNLGIGIQEFRVHDLKLLSIKHPIIHKDNANIKFTESIQGEYHEIAGEMTVRISSVCKIIEIYIRGYVRANYEQPVISYRMQDYLFTYMCANIRRQPKLKMFLPYLQLPASLKSCSKSKVEWDRVIQNEFHWVEESGFETVEQLDPSPDLPHILMENKEPVRLKKMPLSENDEAWKKCEEEFYVSMQEIYEREKRYQKEKISILHGEQRKED